MVPTCTGEGNTVYTAYLLLLLLLSRFSRVRLCATPETAAQQAPLSLGFSRQEHWSALPFPSPMHEREKWKWSQSCLTLSDPMDCSLLGSSVHGIFQAGRVLEWGAIAFSGSPTTSNPHISSEKCNDFFLWVVWFSSLYLVSFESSDTI